MPRHLRLLRWPPIPWAGLAWIVCAAQMATAGEPRLPYRFLLVISDQWQDPGSEVIEGSGEFPIVVSLLKTWGLPFEVLRLDQQRLDLYHLLDRNGRPRYGTILWDAGPDRLEGKGVERLQTLVKDHGVNLVVLGDAVAAPEIGLLTGLRHVSGYALPQSLSITRDHFITRGLEGREKDFLSGGGRLPGTKVEVDGATVLAARGRLPFVATRTLGEGGRVVWLDAHRPSAQIGRQVVRDLLKRCLVWAQGYALYAEYPRSVLLEMHDMGTSDKTFLPYWHYRSLTEDEIRSSIIEPLRRHKAVLNQIVNTGYVDRKSQRVLSPWQQREVADELDSKTVHDYASTKRGLDAGQREGVFEIQSHGWTHMLPDLDSPPGPFWAAPLDGVATLDWYNEFRDRIRDREIPAAVQKLHLQRAIEHIQEDFAVTPLFFTPGGEEFSRSYPNHTGRLAARLGFGLARLGSPVFLARDLVISLGAVAGRGTAAYDVRLTAADVPWTVDGPYFIVLHDRDVAMDGSVVERLLTDLGDGVRYRTTSEYCGYLHAEVSRDTNAGSVLSLEVRYDAHYCRYFESHASSWVLHVSDETRRSLETEIPERQIVDIQKGIGRHTVRVGSLRPASAVSPR